MKLEQYIDHTLLRADATEEDIKKLCSEALEHNFCCVCVNGSHLGLCRKLLAGSGVRIAAVVGFPLGACSLSTKVFEAKEAIENGADEIDMVISIGSLKAGRDREVSEEIRAVKNAIGSHILKVILETCLLEQDEIVRGCELAVGAGSDFVKTSTGFSTGGASASDVALMRKTVGDRCGVKASGGIRDYLTAVQMLEAGANRLGLSRSVAIVSEQQMSESSS